MAKKINITYLLALPFIIVPFLITHRFQDPTLLIKRSSLFFIFLIIAIIFLLLKVKINSIVKTQKTIFFGIILFLGYLLIVSRLNSINVVESFWGILYLCGWLGVYALFVLFSSQIIMKQIIFTTSIIGGILSILILIEAIEHILPNLISPQNGYNYHSHSKASHNSSEIKAPDGTFSATKIFDTNLDQERHSIRFGYKFKSNAFENILRENTPNLLTGETYTFSTHILIPSDLSETESWNSTGFTSIEGKQTVKNSDWETSACLLNGKIYRRFNWDKNKIPDEGWKECISDSNGLTGQTFLISNQINADLSKTDQWQRIGGSFTVDDPLKHGEFYSIRVSLGRLGKGHPKTDHYLYVWGAQIEQGNNLTEYDDTVKGRNILVGGKIRRFYSNFTNSLTKLFNQLNISLPSKGGLSSTFGYKNFFSMYLCFVIPASIISIFLVYSRIQESMHTIMLFLGSIALMLTRTRAAWLAVFISIVVFIVIYKTILVTTIKMVVKNKKFLGLWLILIIIFFTTTTIPVKQWNKKTVWKTIATLGYLNNDTQWGNRLTMYSSTVNMIKDNPIFGVGIENWRINYPQYAGYGVNDHNFKQIRQRPHNDLLWITAEVGIIGLVFLFIFFIFHLKPVLFSIININNKDPTELQLINTFIILSILAIVVESMFDFPRQRTLPNLYLWSMMGFIASTVNHVKGNYQITAPICLSVVLFVVTVFTYFDIKANIYSQDAMHYNNSNMPKELYVSSAISLSYYRNIDYAGTPINYYMGIAQYTLGNKEKAQLNFQKALDNSPYHVGAMMNYLIVAGELGDLRTAHKMMDKIKNIFPKMVKPRLDMAKFYLVENLHEYAKKILIEMKNQNLDDKYGTRNRLLSIIKERNQ